MSSRWSATMIGAALVICLILNPAALPSAQETKEPGTPPQPGISPPISPLTPGAGMPMGKMAQFLSGFGSMKQNDPQVSPAAVYPMFQIIGPIMPTVGNPTDPVTMGNLLRLQGELMIKMGEVMTKYGQMMLEQNKPEVGSK